jgi:hypothetical protein
MVCVIKRAGRDFDPETRRRGPWRSFEAVEIATLEWVDWFNHCRLLQPYGNIPPAEAEEHYYAMLEQPAMAACPKSKASGDPGRVHDRYRSIRPTSAALDTTSPNDQQHRGPNSSNQLTGSRPKELAAVLP